MTKTAQIRGLLEAKGYEVYDCHYEAFNGWYISYDGPPDGQIIYPTTAEVLSDIDRLPVAVPRGGQAEGEG